MAKKQFKAESKRLLDLMVNSIYTHKEIFLREIISNASDAIDKLCYQSLTDDGVGLERGDFRIRVTADKDAGTLTVSDNGIGMSREDMESNLGVIARSGSFKFKSELGEDAEKADIDIIGQFGVGFYSAFMVADRVTVISRAYGAETASVWESTGADGYTISDGERDAAGTDVIMHIKPDGEEEKYRQYLESWRLKELIKKYSDYVRWPIVMDVEHYEQQETGETDENGEPKLDYVPVMREETVNSMVPIWQRAKSEVSDEDCMKFYNEKFHDGEDPLSVIRVNAEGMVSYKAMLFIPARAPYDYYTRDYKPGLELYSSGVMIMDRCADLLPECFRFVRGVVDSPDLSLNISRELLQHDRQLKIIAGNLEKKIKSELKKLLENDREKYAKFWKSFGPQIKYGVVGDYGMKKDQLKDLLVYEGSHGEGLVSLDEYAKMMPESQKYIYYAAGESTQRASKLPQSEQVLDAGFNLLYMTEDVDEFVVQLLGEYEGKKFCNVSSDDLGLETDVQKADTERKEEENRDLLDFVKESLDGQVESVKLSHKLKSHPVCLTTEGDITLEVEKYFNSLPMQAQQPIKAKKVLELNGGHPAFEALKTAYGEDKEKAKAMSKILLGQAKLIAGLPLDDPSAYAELVCGLF
ncbi:MAG: molecular chaperone HtpG [Butyricicoccus sp.]|nr:molecular chaperone HtpG [Butyricicoccus sp.]